MDSYIVRIYRRTGDPPELVGQVERVGMDTKEIFHNSSELVKVLMRGCELCGISGTGSGDTMEKDVD